MCCLEPGDCLLLHSLFISASRCSVAFFTSSERRWMSGPPGCKTSRPECRTKCSLLLLLLLLESCCCCSEPSVEVSIVAHSSPNCFNVSAREIHLSLACSPETGRKS